MANLELRIDILAQLLNEQITKINKLLLIAETSADFRTFRGLLKVMREQNNGKN